MTTNSLCPGLTGKVSLDLPEDQLLATFRSPSRKKMLIKFGQQLHAPEKAVLGHQDKIQVVLQDGSHASNNGSIIGRQVHHSDVVLVHQVLNDELGVGNNRTVIIGYPGTLALGSSVVSEVYVKFIEYL